ncbi:MAG: hypothetical protein LC803_17775 [Acidobacteria bacterium]|nr:hypothetical protein [Acidobacteriota bacterium]
MSNMGRYCKAYPVERLQEFEGWTDNYRRPEKDESSQSGDDTQPTENDYLFLQENFIVTKDIFIDEDVVYDNISPQWIDFCKNTLDFKVPSDVAQAGD